MTIRFLAAAALLATSAAPVLAQGWGGEGADPNNAKPVSEAHAVKPAAPKPAAPKQASAPAAKQGSGDLNDAELDRARAHVDRQLAARKARLNQRTARLASYHIAMERDSGEAERQMAEERKAFLLYLKSVPQEDRAGALRAFEDRLDGKRKELDKRHLSQYKAWYQENIADDWRSEPLIAEKVSAPAPVAVAAAEEAPAEEMADAPAAATSVAATPAPKASVARAKAKKRTKR